MAPNKNDPPGKMTPQPVTSPKNLNPIFGSHCCTQAFSFQGWAEGVCHIHFEACLDDPVRRTWSVNKVVRVLSTTETHVHQVAGRMDFRSALATLCQFEKEHLADGKRYNPLFPDPPLMGFSHFKAFAEREGYVFDIDGMPHARPAPDALPPGASFRAADIASSTRNLQRPENEFNGAGPASKAPDTHFLFDQFTRAVHDDSMNGRLASMRLVSILDRLVNNVDIADRKLKEYCRRFRELGQGGLIAEAEEALAGADACVKQIKAYGVDTTDFESFVLQCKITCHILHAEGLYDLMSKGKGDFSQNEAAFKQRVTEAVGAFQKIDNSEQGLQRLKNMIVQTEKPEVPATIGAFIDNYRRQREKFDAGQNIGPRGKGPRP